MSDSKDTTRRHDDRPLTPRRTRGGGLTPDSSVEDALEVEAMPPVLPADLASSPSFPPPAFP